MQCPQKWILLVVVYVPDDPQLAFCLVHILDDVKIDADFQVLLLDIVSYLSCSGKGFFFAFRMDLRSRKATSLTFTWTIFFKQISCRSAPSKLKLP